MAAESFVDGGINRVILATDGDFNVGVSSEGDLVRLIEEKRKSGVFLSVLGFGQGNLKDSKMEKLADHGNGNYAYIDSVREARKVLVTEAGATLVTIAKDVKIQVEFNPARVAAYRLIGYENRALRAEDFDDDTQGRRRDRRRPHRDRALRDRPGGRRHRPAGRRSAEVPATPSATRGRRSHELLTVKLRYKEPDGDTSRLRSVAVCDLEPGREPSANLRFASAVAAFGMLLRESEHRGSATWDQVIDLARGAVGDDPDGHRTEFLVLARNAEQLVDDRAGRDLAVKARGQVLSCCVASFRAGDAMKQDLTPFRIASRTASATAATHRLPLLGDTGRTPPGGSGAQRWPPRSQCAPQAVVASTRTAASQP